MLATHAHLQHVQNAQVESMLRAESVAMRTAIRFYDTFSAESG